MNKLLLQMAALMFFMSACTGIGSDQLPASTNQPAILLQGADPSPPESAVKLVFIHHSTGGNWLADAEANPLGGGLGQALMENNYFVSATNYGWGPNAIGDRTDIGNWWEWFRGPDSEMYLEALYSQNGQSFGDYGEYPRLADQPIGENQIIVFKSCYPNSGLRGNPNDPIPPIEENPIRSEFAGDKSYTVANAKGVYVDLLEYFNTRPDKLFVVVTAPPLAKSATNSQEAANARTLNNWLLNDWLDDYPLKNVAVFDFYNVLTAPESHHWYQNGNVVHVTSQNNFSFFPSSKSDSHPNRDGNNKATQEFLQLLNAYYNEWNEGQ